MIRRWLCVGVLLAVILAGLGLITTTVIDRWPVPPFGNPVGDGHSSPIAGSTRVGQAFVAPLPGMNRIEVKLGPGPAAGSWPVVLHLKASPGEADDLWAGECVRAGEWCRVEFPPLLDSRGRTYYFYLESPAAPAAGAAVAGYGPQSGLAGAGAYVDDRPVAGNLQFSTFYSLRWGDKLDRLVDRTAGSRPGLPGSRVFSVVAVAVCALVLGGLMVGVALLAVDDGQGA